ncbi:hypothetical protein PFISCL1PPCAC_1408, partial [Pristionchus fissidentatus]
VRFADEEKEEENKQEKTITNASSQPTNYHSSGKLAAEIVPVDPKQNEKSKFADEFKNIKEIGSGVYGRVFEAENILDKCKYAVKRIAFPRDSNEDLISKKLREVQAMAKFDHSNIVRYYGSWTERPPQDHNMYLHILMQLCKHSLAYWLMENYQQPRDQQRMRYLFKQLVDAVAYIHRKEVIHRDLKPSNILFDEVDRIRVCDLGLATNAISSIDGEEITGTRTVIGTPLYKSPEQSYNRYTSKVDVFSIGLIYAEMSVKMKGEVRRNAFDNYRKGVPNNFAIDDVETRELIDLMTKVKSDDRPTSREI